jgi:hypothetical protein
MGHRQRKGRRFPSGMTNKKAGSKSEGTEEDGGGWGDGVVEFGDSGEGGGAGGWGGG